MPLVKQPSNLTKYTLCFIFLWAFLGIAMHPNEATASQPSSDQKTSTQKAVAQETETSPQAGNLTAALVEEADPQWGRTPPIDGEATILHGLDKTTARVFAMEAKHGQQIKFGTLRITVRGCKKNPPEEQPEAGAFLEILEEKTGDTPVTLFSGWMFSSSPAISGLEHPVYDVWVTDCLPAKSAAPKALLTQETEEEKAEPSPSD